jgi:Uma2 family endonuclease
MSAPARKQATWEDLLRTPDDGRVYEVLDGQIEGLPRPLPRHGRAQARLAGQLSGPFDPGEGGPGGWWLLIEPEVRLAVHQIVVPDMVGWRRERMPSLPDARPIDLVPDWIAEVVSPSDVGRDRVRKANLYLAAGLPFYWIVDPAERTLEAYAAHEGSWLRLGGWTDGDTPRVPPFEAVALDVGSLFPPA